MKDMRELVRRNVTENPQLGSLEYYFAGIVDEVSEVRAEIKEDNHVFLTDELSDILWDYLNILALCEKEGLIKSVESVLEHGQRKYEERLPALLAGSEEMWDDIKQKQKGAVKKQHEAYYDKD